MPIFWQVTLNGHPLKKRMASKQEAEAMAERWQGTHANGRGLLKHKDRGDWVEVKRDVASEREFDDMYDTYKRGNPQRYVTTGGE